MRKLLIATDNFLPRWDGISRFLSEIIPKLARAYDITVLAPNFKGYNQVKQEFGNITIHRFDTFNFKVGDFPPAMPPGRKVKNYIKEADIVWIQSIGPIGYSTAKWARKMEKPLMAFTHSIEWELVSNAITGFSLFRKIIEILVKRIAKKVYNKCDLLMVPSQDTAQRIRKAGIRTLMKQVNLGIDTNKFRPAANKKEAKKSIGISPEKTVISFIGRLGLEKDLITLYRAFIQLLYKYKNIVLLIVGEGLERYKRMFKREHMVYIGPRADVEKFYQATDIYVLPSLTETTSLTTMEAMASGCAVISTKVGAIPSYVINKYNGMFFRKRNSYVLRKKIEFLMENEELRRKLGENARNTIKAQYSWDKTVEEIKDVLNVY
ncbi:glycosyltransferase family 4 protein [Candidatus Woesearchaeota archaeon]|nr:glycosyltransferase family 4 protein [Candidatus Woesearchaeota archaeon]